MGLLAEAVGQIIGVENLFSILLSCPDESDSESERMNICDVRVEIEVRLDSMGGYSQQ